MILIKLIRLIEIRLRLTVKFNDQFDELFGIFKKMKLLTVKNLYRQRCIMEIFKIIKYKVPVSMISLVRESERKECQLITPFPSHNFTYQSAWLWNKFKSVNR